MNPMIPAQPMPFALTPDAYRQLKHAASLKGLSKPFKGKGELEHLAQVAKNNRGAVMSPDGGCGAAGRTMTSHGVCCG